jgi:hypothetical protein
MKNDLYPLNLMKAREVAREIVFEDPLDFLEESAHPKEVVRQLRKMARAGQRASPIATKAEFARRG